MSGDKCGILITFESNVDAYNYLKRSHFPAKAIQVKIVDGNPGAAEAYKEDLERLAADRKHLEEN